MNAPSNLGSMPITWSRYKGNDGKTTVKSSPRNPRMKKAYQPISRPPGNGTPWGFAHLIQQHLWWPKMASEVEQYVKGCTDCQRNKVNTQTRKAPLSPIFAQPEILPFATIAMDFIVKLPKSQGYNSILTITDQGCTKMAIFLPCHKTIDAEGVAQLYFTHVFPRFGVPSKVISD